MLGKLYEGVDLARHGGRDGAVEPDGVAQIPEPVLGQREVGGDGLTQSRSDAVDVADEKALIAHPASHRGFYLVAKLIDHAGVCRIANRDEPRKPPDRVQRIHRRRDGGTIPGDAHQAWRIDHRHLCPPGLTSQHALAFVAVGGNHRHRIIVRGDVLDRARPSADDQHRILESHLSRQVGTGNFALTVADNGIGVDADRAPHHPEGNHLHEERRLHHRGAVAHITGTQQIGQRRFAEQFAEQLMAAIDLGAE